MSDAPNEDNWNWLNAEMIECPRCHERLYRLDHSPFLDDYQLYCDKCSSSAVISLYDPVFTTIFHELRSRGCKDYSTLMTGIEQRLKLCSCGGQYRHDAPRRCPYCLYEVIAEASGVDLWPSYYGIDVDERDPIGEEIALVGQFEAAHVRRENIWK